MSIFIRSLVRWLPALGLAFTGLMQHPFTAAADPQTSSIDYNRDIRPILSNACIACHGPDDAERKADLRLDTRAAALEGEAFVPGQPAASLLLARVRSDNPAEVMPPPKTGKRLKPEEIAKLEAWIAQGAPYATHWSYQPPQRHPVPPVRDQARVRQPLDAFLLARLQDLGLSFEPEADRATLIRRVSLDLTGLPPTVAEVDEFLADPRPDAYEQLIDRLLAKPAFGEHWARLWLDLARYADSAGYADDVPRVIWPYRDWVIRAFNRNLPYDQFTIEQLAGDLLPHATTEQRVATAFHRNTMTNNEGGTDDEEFRNAAVVDRVNTTMTVWMGTSFACAQCHTHKYDPLTQTEYFQLFAIFNQTADADRRDESPLLTLEASPQREAWQQQRQRLAEAALYPAAVLHAWRPTALAQLDRSIQQAPAPVTVPILEELPPPKRRTTHLQRRGNFRDLGDVVRPGLPEAFPGPKPAGPIDRLALARWLVSPENPLSARVAVNRFWEAIFGTGLVRTSEEFGSQGELPTHPELLDHLALDFSQPTQPGRTPWDMKALLKTLVTSSAYRQSSVVTAEKLAKDPENLALSRGPRVRLTAEMVRDQALFVSGLLSPKMFGPSVKPPQPAFGLSAAFGSGLDWQPSPGEDRYRRALYTEWRRTNPYPSMMTFDATSREACTVRRGRSNTPLQALVTLNDVVYLEAATQLAQRTLAVPADARWNEILRRVLARPATPAEAARLQALYQQTLARYQADPAAATALVGQPNPEWAAWTVVANVLLNLDEFLMKR